MKFSKLLETRDALNDEVMERVHKFVWAQDVLLPKLPIFKVFRRDDTIVVQFGFFNSEYEQAWPLSEIDK